MHGCARRRRYPKIFARYFSSEERKSLTFGLELYCVYVTFGLELYCIYVILALVYIYYISDCLKNLLHKGNSLTKVLLNERKRKKSIFFS